MRDLTNYRIILVSMNYIEFYQNISRLQVISFDPKAFESTYDQNDTILLSFTTIFYQE
jgi:hypothetical protein